MVEPLPFLEGVPYAGLITQTATFLVTLLAVWLVTRYLAVRALRRGMAARGVDAHAQRMVELAASVALFVLAAGVAFAVAGFRVLLASTATIVAALTVAVGFAAQDAMRNVAGGIFIFVERPFRIGDWIAWRGSEGAYEGVVEDIRVRVTRVRTFDNELLTVPNGLLTDTVLKNVVAFDILRLRYPFHVGFEDDVAQAERIIVDEAERHPDVLADPAPGVVVTELGESGVVLESRMWIEDATRRRVLRVQSEYVQAVKARFDAEGITVPYPQRSLSGTLRVDGGGDGAHGREGRREAAR